MNGIEINKIYNEVMDKIYTGGENRAMFMISPSEELYVEVIADENGNELYTHIYITNVFGIETFSKKVPYGDVTEVISVIEDALISTTQVAA